MGFFSNSNSKSKSNSCNPIIKAANSVAISIQGLIYALCSFVMGKLGMLYINANDEGGEVQNLPTESRGTVIICIRHTPVVWVKEGACYDFKNEPVKKDFLWCKFAENLDDSYTDENGLTCYYLKEDYPEVLWLLDDMDSFHYDNKAFGDIHHNWLKSVAIVPGKHFKTVECEHGAKSTKRVTIFGSYDTMQKRVELYIDEIREATNGNPQAFINLFASTYAQEMMYAYFDSIYHNLSNNYMADDASKQFLTAYFKAQSANKVKITL